MCEFRTEWGPCRQQSLGLCAYHRVVDGRPTFTHDRYYHEKIARGLLEPTSSYMSDEEADLLFRGTARRDGRRTDLWVLD